MPNPLVVDRRPCAMSRPWPGSRSRPSRGWSTPRPRIWWNECATWAGAGRTLQELRLQHHVALIDFDDLPLADLLKPGVPVIAQDQSAIAQEADALLFDRIEGGQGAA